MANFANTDAGRSLAEALVRTRMAAKTWIVGFRAQTKDGNTCVRYQRPMSHTADDEGAWLESRDTAAT